MAIFGDRLTCWPGMPVHFAGHGGQNLGMNIPFEHARFLKSASSSQDFPPDTGAEVAFCGRSNAGKSSAINAICRQNCLARTSKTPGRTQVVNFFNLDSDARLVDLPGYGYAKAPARVQQRWQNLMESYLVHRQALCGLVLSMDIRHPLTDIDWTMIQWSIHYRLPLYILLTKADKLSRNAMAKSLTRVTSELEQQGFDAGTQIFSATKRTGISQAQAKISAWIAKALMRV